MPTTAPKESDTITTYIYQLVDKAQELRRLAFNVSPSRPVGHEEPGKEKSASDAFTNRALIGLDDLGGNLDDALYALRAFIEGE